MCFFTNLILKAPMKNLLLTFILVSAMAMQATHNRSGEITYKRIQPFTNAVNGLPVYTYSITVTLYTDFGDQTADRCMDTLYFGDGTKTVLNRENGSGSMAGCQCAPKCGEIIMNQPGYNVKKNIYSATHTYPGAGQYVTYTVDRNRNQNISNIPNSINTAFYVEALIIANANTGSNASPVLNNPPIDIAYNVNCFYHQPGATDADGDSLSYELIGCKGYNGAPIAGYTQPPVNPNGYYYMNTSGLISWCTPPNIGEYNIAFYVREWRKINGVYQLNGIIERDFQVLVKAGVLSVNNRNSDLSATEVMPVPFSETLRVESMLNKSAAIHAQVFDLNGKLLLSGEGKGTTISFDTEGLPPGVYLIRVECGNDVSYRKVVRTN